MVSNGIILASANILIFGEEEGNSHDPLIQDMEKKYGDIETIVSTTKHYKKKGKHACEISAQSLVVYHKSVPSKVNYQSVVSQQRKSSTNKSNDGGEKNPPRGKLENPQKLKVKRKINSSQQEDKEHTPGNEIPLEYTNLDVDIDNI
jgi:hypothetical protein